MVPPPRLRRIRLTLVLLLVVAGVLAWLAARPGPRDVSTDTVHPGSSIPLTDVAPYGANFFLEREADPWVRRRTVEMAREAGIRWAKQQFLWSYIEQEPGVFSFDDYDAIVDLLLENDIEVIARLDWPPDWVPKPDWVPEGFRARQNVPPADVAAYGAFVSRTVRHFQGRVRFYQIWNEPNLISEWGFDPDHPVDPKEYTDLLKAAADAARAVDPNVVILSAPLAINLESVDYAGNMSDLDYLEGMYAAGADEFFDVLSANGFGMEQDPGARPGEGILNLRRLELQRSIMVENGDIDTPIWLAEYGWNAAPTTAREANWGRVEESAQSRWTVEGVHWADEHWPWAGVFNIWYFRQWGGLDPERAVYYFRMVDTDFTPRRVLDAVKADAADRFVAGPGVWAERSAPVALPRDLADRKRWSWVWSEGADDRGALQSSEPGATLTFSFRGASVWARVLTGPQAGSVQLEMDGHRLSTPDGDATWLLQSAAREWSWVRLADGLSEGAHELRITVGTSGGTVAIDSYRVDARHDDGNGISPSAVILGLVGLGCLALLALDADRVVRRLGE